MEFKIRTHKITDNGFEIYKVGGHTPLDLQGYYSDKKIAEAAIAEYMIKAIAKKEELEKQVEEEKAKAAAAKKPAAKTRAATAKK